MSGLDDTDPDIDLAEILKDSLLQLTEGCIHAVPRHYLYLDIKDGRLPLESLSRAIEKKIKQAQRTQPAFPTCQYGGKMEITWSYEQKTGTYMGQFYCRDCARLLAKND